jgi:hypothetical protein
MNGNTVDPKYFNFVSQIAHISATYGLSYTAYTKFGIRGFLIAALGILIYAIWHEFFYDPRKENPATRGSDLEDFLFLCFGPLLAAAVHAL